MRCIPRQLVESPGFVAFDKTAIDKSITDIFEQQVRAHPDNVAVKCPERTLTYCDLDRLSNRIAHAILARLDEREEPVTLLLRQGSTTVAAILGALKAGKIYVPVDPLWPAGELRKIIADCRPGLILTGAESRGLANDLTGTADQWLDVEAIGPDESSKDVGLVFAPERVCSIYYTSGSTGAPKGVYDDHRNVLHNVMRYTNSLGISAADRLSLIQSPSFSGTASSLFAALMNGAALYPFDLHREGIERLADWIVAQRITIFHSVPMIFEALVARGRAFDSLRVMRLEGDRTERRHVELFQEHFDDRCVLVNGLGTTETGLIRQFFVGPKTRISSEAVPVGYPTPDMTIRIVDEGGTEVEAGSIGEIAVASRYLARGYWKRPRQTAAAFAQDVVDETQRTYRTGDLGRMFPDGCLEYLGRMDFCPKLRGHRIDIPAIENALRSLSMVERAIVVVHDERPGVQRLVAYIVAATACVPTVEDIKRALAGSLPAHMIPTRYVFVDELPLDQNWKVDRRRLPPPGHVRPRLGEKFVTPRSPIERTVAASFRDVLNVDSVGLHDDFFDLGGDSLLHTELLALIEKNLGTPWLADVEPVTVWTITQRLNDDTSTTALVPIRPGGSRPPLFCMHNYSGSVSEYRRLADILDLDQPVYGLQCHHSPTARTDAIRVEDLAAAYVPEIRKVQPEGRYRLCGNCFGGVVAFEVARKLKEQGQEVDLLVLIDTAFPVGLRRRMAQQFENSHRWPKFAELPIAEKVSYLAYGLAGFGRWVIRETRLRARFIRARAQALGDHGTSRLIPTDAHKLAARRYRPRMYDGEIVLICPGAPHNQRGWERVAGQGMRTCEVRLDGGPHHPPHLIVEPYVDRLAALMDRELRMRL